VGRKKFKIYTIPNAEYFLEITRMPEEGEGCSYKIPSEVEPVKLDTGKYKDGLDDVYYVDYLIRYAKEYFVVRQFTRRFGVTREKWYRVYEIGGGEEVELVVQ